MAFYLNWVYQVIAHCKKGHDPQSHLCLCCCFATFLSYVDLRDLTDTNAISAISCSCSSHSLYTRYLIANFCHTCFSHRMLNLFFFFYFHLFVTLLLLCSSLLAQLFQSGCDGMLFGSCLNCVRMHLVMALPALRPRKFCHLLYGATMYFRRCLDTIMLLCSSMIRKQCEDFFSFNVNVCLWRPSPELSYFIISQLFDSDFKIQLIFWIFTIHFLPS